MVVSKPNSITEKVTAWLSVRDFLMLGGVFLAGAGWAWKMDAQVAGIARDVAPLIQMTDELQQRVQRLEDTGFRGSGQDDVLEALIDRMAAIEITQARVLVSLEAIQESLRDRKGGG